MKLVLYSDGPCKSNHDLDKALLEVARGTRSQVTYVPFTHSEHSHYYQEFKDYYRRLGLKSFVYFAPNKLYSPQKIREAFSSDIIYLSSGNTFTFLKHLREQKLVPHLQKFLKRGGVLAGASAGAILMTPNIMTAAVPVADSDTNKVGIKNLSAMALVPFEFSPHYHRGQAEELKSYSRFTGFPILACEDGAGIVVENDRIRIVGEAIKFKNGKKSLLKRNLKNTEL